MLLIIALCLSVLRKMFCSLDTRRPSLFAIDMEAVIAAVVENIPIAVEIATGPEMMNLFSLKRALW